MKPQSGDVVEMNNWFQRYKEYDTRPTKRSTGLRRMAPSTYFGNTMILNARQHTSTV